ncbi:unnamed protein product [Cladocopium goreaui]|uniref:Transmembrane protein n=1 Tax=Cladocopium goreaui TaxID=2562237 RepID=A0A9P1BGL1_9DINO|nr:unnamed protein product [Cladocopium goreaui]
MVGLVSIAAGSASAMMTAGAVSVLCEAIPQGLALIVAVRGWDEPCNQPLQLWLAVVGAIGVSITVPAVLVLCRERRKIQQTMGNQEMVAYLVRKQRAQADQQAFEENESFENELKEFRTAPSLSDCLIRFVQCPLLIWEILGIVWYLNSSSDNQICSDSLRSLGYPRGRTLGSVKLAAVTEDIGLAATWLRRSIVLLKLFMPCVTCCCVIACGLGAGLAHLPEVAGEWGRFVRGKTSASHGFSHGD